MCQFSKRPNQIEVTYLRNLSNAFVKGLGIYDIVSHQNKNHKLLNNEVNKNNRNHNNNKSNAENNNKNINNYNYLNENTDSATTKDTNTEFFYVSKKWCRNRGRFEDMREDWVGVVDDWGLPVGVAGDGGNDSGGSGADCCSDADGGGNNISNVSSSGYNGTVGENGVSTSNCNTGRDSSTSSSTGGDSCTSSSNGGGSSSSSKGHMIDCDTTGLNCKNEKTNTNNDKKNNNLDNKIGINANNKFDVTSCCDSCMVKKWKKNKEMVRLIDPCSGDDDDPNNNNLSKNKNKYRELRWKNLQIKTGDCVYLLPSAYDNKNNKQNKKDHNKKESSSSSDDDDVKNDSKNSNEDSKYENDIIYPERYRKGNYVKGSNDDVSMPYRVCQIVEVCCGIKMTEGGCLLLIV